VRAPLGVRLPRGLRPGGLVGVCAPSGSVDAGKLAAGIAALEGLGFAVRAEPGLLERKLFSAGSAARRVEELHALVADPEVAAILCARGGAGVSELLPRLDPELFRAHPKPFVGYSDLTLMHSFLGRLGLVSFHGPMLAGELASGAYDPASFARALCSGESPWSVPAQGLRCLRPGEAEGILRGGCLSLLAAATGTAWALPTAAGQPSLLLIEEVDEPPYRVHRLLTQLCQSGALAGVTGIVFGEMRGCAPDAAETYRLEEVILDALQGLELPVAMGLACGHSPTPMLTLPLGVTARLECGGSSRLEILGPWLE
jgi:muramoyltetrapeptide carboxypeptidase